MNESGTPETDALQSEFNAKSSFELNDVLEAYELARSLERRNKRLVEALNYIATPISKSIMSQTANIPTPRTDKAIRSSMVAGCAESYLAVKMAELERENVVLRQALQEARGELAYCVLYWKPQQGLIQRGTILKPAKAWAEQVLKQINEALTPPTTI